MKRAVAIVTGIVALTASVALKADQRKEDEKFCAAVASYQSDAAEFKAIGPHSTVAELRAALSRLHEHFEQMQKAAKRMNTPTAKQFTDAMNQLDKDVSSVSDDATLQQVRSKIEADAQKARSTGRQLAAEAGCPQPAK